MGEYQTNCYIVSVDSGDIIIDPGVDSTSWVKANVDNPVAILNTHGHFDHVWCNAELQKELKIPLYTPKDDAFFLQSSSFMPSLPPSVPDYLVEPNETLEFGTTKISFLHFPGHTPGSSVIAIDDAWFSGDFIFERSIGRTDFPYSNANDMKNSLTRFKNIPYNKTIYPGHGNTTTIEQEQRYTDFWIEQL